jgi:hypothetical protein
LGKYSKGLWSVPVDGGQETEVSGFESLTGGGWTITDNGILWMDLTTANPPAAIRFYDFAIHAVSKIAEVPGWVIPSATGFSASRDGTVLMWSQLDRSTHDLMVMDGFR